MKRTFVIGVGTTAFGPRPGDSHADLAAEVLEACRADAGLPEGEPIDAAWFGCTGLPLWGQVGLGGVHSLQASVERGLLPEGVPVTTVEGGCATGGLALRSAAQAVEAGDVDLALAVGVEKTWFDGAPEKLGTLLASALDQLHPERWADFYREAAASAELPFDPSGRGGPLLEVCALAARWDQREAGLTLEDLAAVVEASRRAGAANPDALHRKALTAAEVVAEKPVAGPLTRSMCASPVDGAAAALLASAEFLALHPELRARAVPLRGLASAGGRWRGLGETSVVARALAALLEEVPVSPADLDVVELHDSTAAAALARVRDLGLAPESVAVNPSGGILARGHPIAATGLAQVAEVCRQLRGEAGERQVPGATLGLTENAGGLVGFDEAVCVVGLFAGPGET